MMNKTKEEILLEKIKNFDEKELHPLFDYYDDSNYISGSEMYKILDKIWNEDKSS